MQKFPSACISIYFNIKFIVLIKHIIYKYVYNIYVNI